MKKFSGTILKLKRKELNLSLDEVSSITKISKRILKKIEDSDFIKMSSSQEKYLVKNYANFIGIKSEIEFTRKNEDLLANKENSRISIFEYFFLNLLMPLLIIIVAIIFYYNYERNNISYLEKLVDIDNHLSNSFSKKIEKDQTINDYIDDNFGLEKYRVEPVSNKGTSSQDDTTEILSLSFSDEVWIEIKDNKEIILNGVFQKSDVITLEVIKKDNIFITSGNLGLISIKTNHSNEKTLGLNGEIGRKKLF
tara:strand:- start:162 stop:917 length:756 start_codon:yes stop_codon:yes gene_type:complete